MVGAHDADDAWSETFLAAMRAYPHLPDDANVEAWLVTIARRKGIDILRKMKRSATPMAEVPTEARFDDDSGRSDLVELLAQLSERQRSAVICHYLGGLPYAEVATVMGGSTDAARRAAADGIANLRRAKEARQHATEGTVR